MRRSETHGNWKSNFEIIIFLAENQDRADFVMASPRQTLLVIEMEPSKATPP